MALPNLVEKDLMVKDTQILQQKSLLILNQLMIFPLLSILRKKETKTNQSILRMKISVLILMTQIMIIYRKFKLLISRVMEVLSYRALVFLLIKKYNCLLYKI